MASPKAWEVEWLKHQYSEKKSWPIIDMIEREPGVFIQIYKPDEQEVSMYGQVEFANSKIDYEFKGYRNKHGRNTDSVDAFEYGTFVHDMFMHSIHDSFRPTWKESMKGKPDQESMDELNKRIQEETLKLINKIKSQWKTS